MYTIVFLIRHQIERCLDPTVSETLRLLTPTALTTIKTRHSGNLYGQEIPLKFLCLLFSEARWACGKLSLSLNTRPKE